MNLLLLSNSPNGSQCVLLGSPKARIFGTRPEPSEVEPGLLDLD